MRRASSVIAAALSLLAVGVIVSSAGAVPEGSRAAAACKPGGKAVQISGRTAYVFCGPASATVKLGGRTLTFSKGTCVWTSNSFKLELGTIFLFWKKPFPRQPGFAIRANGYPVARALVQIYWQGQLTNLSTTRTTARPSANRAGGTFEGRTAAGARVTGSVRCR
jgi:hypothetical protein